jgi:hypothetical protein
MLQRDDIDVEKIQILGRAAVRGRSVVADHEPDLGGLAGVARGGDYRHHQTLRLGEFRGDGIPQVAGVGGDPALPRGIGADEGDPVEGHGLHWESPAGIAEGSADACGPRAARVGVPSLGHACHANHPGDRFGPGRGGISKIDPPASSCRGP